MPAGWEVTPDTVPSFLERLRTSDFGEGIKKLSICSVLGDLESSGILTDNELKKVIEYCPNLCDLELYRCLSLTEDGLKMLDNLTSLKRLSLIPKPIQESALSFVGFFSNIPSTHRAVSMNTAAFRC
ncbi:MAG: hypothetical protein P0S96_00060 [Simkaniaceae bacterium]|nr:hypothetical protein [Candidatus Sacchlamyda saccharinae]